ncbi:MAG: hypothetical protein ACRDX9_02205 [Acidimicrobiia bacterium]
MAERLTPEQIQTLRRLALNDEALTSDALSGNLAGFHGLDGRTSALVRVAALISMAPDSSSYPWAIDQAMAAGVGDEEVFSALIAIAPIIGVARLNEGLAHLMEALELDTLES